MSDLDELVDVDGAITIDVSQAANVVDQIRDNFHGAVDADLACLDAKLLIATYEIHSYCRNDNRPSS